LCPDLDNAWSFGFSGSKDCPEVQVVGKQQMPIFALAHNRTSLSGAFNEPMVDQWEAECPAFSNTDTHAGERFMSIRIFMQ
jgi:hypothetical protein